MFLLFGWGKKTVKNYGDLFPMKCPQCNNTVYYKLIKLTTWFSVFFIPIIPYEKKNLLMCGVCNNSTQLKRGKLDQAKTLLLHTQAFQEDQIDSDTYYQHIQDANLFDKSASN